MLHFELELKAYDSHRTEVTSESAKCLSFKELGTGSLLGTNGLVMMSQSASRPPLLKYNHFEILSIDTILLKA